MELENVALEQMKAATMHMVLNIYVRLCNSIHMHTKLLQRHIKLTCICIIHSCVRPATKKNTMYCHVETPI